MGNFGTQKTGGCVTLTYERADSIIDRITRTCGGKDSVKQAVLRKGAKEMPEWKDLPIDDSGVTTYLVVWYGYTDSKASMELAEAEKTNDGKWVQKN